MENLKKLCVALSILLLIVVGWLTYKVFTVFVTIIVLAALGYIVYWIWNRLRKE